MTKKDRCFVIYRFFLHHGWRFIIAIALIIGLLYICLNLGSILGGFMKKVGEVTAKRTGTENISVIEEREEKNNIEQNINKPKMPDVFIIDGDILVTNSGIFQVGVTIPPWKLLSFDSVSRIATWEYTENEISTIYRSCLVPLRLPEHKE